MKLRFWGTRGSIAKPGPTTLRHGGNTSCVELRTDDGTLIVIDCGTGAHALGRSLLGHPDPLHGHLLIGHTHWDHIQGFPFFAPLFVSNSEWSVYAPGGGDRRLQAALAGQMSYEYSPINIDSLDARIQYIDLVEGVFEIGNVKVTTHYLHHPALTLGFRFEADGASVIYACDHEPHSLHPLEAGPGAQPIHHEDRRHVEFLSGADLIIHDAQYTLEDFPAKTGWGHTPLERAVDYAILAKTLHLVFTHHDPDRDDDAIDAMCESARERASRADHVPKITAAREGWTVEVKGDRPRPQPAEDEPSAFLSSEPRKASTVLIVDDDPEMLLLLETSLRADGIRVLSARNGEDAIALARAELPTLILLDMQLPGRDGLEVCRTLRGDDNPKLRDTPIILLTGLKFAESDLAETFRAGATDFLTKPIKSTLVRARVRSWLLRTVPR